MRDHQDGLVYDLHKLALHRRQMLRLLAGASLVPLFGCGSDGDSGGTGAGASAGAGASNGAAGASGGSASGSCATIPEETGGPYPADGTNGPNTLTTSGIVRSDIRSSFGSFSGTAAGVPLKIELTVVDSTTHCAPLAGYAVYLWHCDRDGNYSMYTVADQNYLRGVQETDDDGKLSFTSIFPACYSGRWPHIHFEVFPSLADAATASGKLKTSQLAMPVDASNAVFATAGYSASIRNLAQVSLSSDMVFSDGVSLQTPTVSGNVTDGYVISLTVGVAA
jgi:protocatechuate 3,4-dioxygenase beta subunit